MRPSAPLEFPSGRHLAGWWKQLGPARPAGLWVAHLLLHRVEALFRTSQSVRLEPLPRLTLDALSHGDTAAGLARRLGVRASVALQMLRQLREEGLVTPSAEDSWGLTDLGRQARERGVYPRAHQERRLYHFVENESGQLPQFLVFRNPAALLPVDPSETVFDTRALTNCLEQTPHWKQRHGFPAEVSELVTPLSAAPALPPWQSVIVDRPGHLIVALVRMPTESGEQLLGYALEPETWNFRSKEPLLTLGAEWPEVFPDLASEPPLAAWRSAWSGWGQRRGLPTVELEACVLEHQANMVRVRAPARLLERLRAARSDALKGEAWLLAGTERARMAARIELQATRDLSAP